MTTATYKNNTLMEKYPKNFLLGHPTDGGRGYLFRRPSFDCGWYWGFGYLGNRDVHFHLDNMTSIHPELANKNMFDQLKMLFGDNLTITNDGDLWKFCEHASAIYKMRVAAELFHRGGSSYTSNERSDSIKELGHDMYETLNSVLIPEQIESLYRVLAKYPDAYRG